jgi:hypothetical protein
MTEEPLNLVVLEEEEELQVLLVLLVVQVLQVLLEVRVLQLMQRNLGEIHVDDLDKVRINGFNISQIDKPTNEVIWAALRQQPFAIQNIPDCLHTKELCRFVCTQDGNVLQYCKYIDDQVELDALDNEGMSLQHVRKQNILNVTTAVNSNGSALQFVEEEFMTEDVCLSAVRNIGSSIKYIPDVLQTPDICLVAVVRDPMALEFVADQTLDIVRVAYIGNAAALRYLDCIISK